MHLIATIPGGWNPDNEGVFVIDQQPGDIVFITAADTEISLLNEVYQGCSAAIGALPSLRMANVLYLKQELSIDHYVEQVISCAKLVVCRLLGGKNYYSYLVEAIRDCCEQQKVPVLFIPGYETPDWELIQLSSHIQAADMVWRYFSAGGNRNLQQCLYYLLQIFFQFSLVPEPPEPLPDIFIAHNGTAIMSRTDFENSIDQTRPLVPVLVYRAHYLSGNLHPVHLLCTALEQQGLNAMPVFVANLRDRDKLDALYQLLARQGQLPVRVIIQTTSFSTKSLVDDEAEGTSFFLQKIGVPVIQAILASVTYQQWAEGLFGLSPTDIAINIALPEIDGRIIGPAISFKEDTGKDATTDSNIVTYRGYAPACNRIAAMAMRWAVLQNKLQSARRIAVIMPNYPNKDSRLANGVGLDTPASVVQLLLALQQDGYHTGNYLPANSHELMQLVTAYITNDETTLYNRPYQVQLPIDVFQAWCQSLSPSLLKKIQTQWGRLEDSPFFQGDHLALPGCILGNIYVGIQPARGYHADPQSIYHSPDLPPTYEYLAFYCWLHQCFGADAIVHTGKHGNLEWLPGKSVALDTASCFPATILPELPHFYPFIINDPGEGTQAKRRNHAVIIDHLVPPMARAETYGALAKMEQLVDEYYEASGIDPKRALVIRQQLQQLVKTEKLEADLVINSNDIDELLLKLDGYLCELKEAQIRDGLHILGQVPQGEQLSGLVVALHRLPSGNIPGITQALAADLQLGFDPLHTDYACSFGQKIEEVLCRTTGDAVEILEMIAHRLVSNLVTQGSSGAATGEKTQIVLDYVRQYTLPKLNATTNEIDHLLQGLKGNYVPSGPSGAPTRGGVQLLPTGRNFYSVDVRCIPTETAYRLGEKSARLIIDRYLQEHGEYPQSIGISVWGTSTMRTGGDDIAQALALLGVRPVWQVAGRRVIDFEVISLLELRRPRVDVTLRISGFFRDAFPDIIALFNAVIEKVALLDEPFDQNPVRSKYLAEKKDWQQKGLSEMQAEQYALYRVFGSRPGAYGVGLQALIDEKNWKTREDLAMVYMNWSAYAYGRNRQVVSSFEVLQKRLGEIQLVMHNQDNREHDILDSDDYYQFQGGMAAAVEMVSGKQPDSYFGDHSRPDTPKVKSLKQELLKVYRSRVINPKWMEGMRRHGYKGAFEMAATMDYLFAYSATTGLVDDFMFEGITQAYLMDSANKKFIEQANPHALKDMAERMLEAIQRGLWKAPSSDMQTGLQEIVLECE
jgi:cobaltochelatase CobN